MCVLGYCLFPLDLAAVINVFVKLLWIRIPVGLLTFGWSIWGACFTGWREGERKKG